MSNHMPARPSTVTYLIVAGFLTVLTGMEVVVSYSRAMQPVLIPVLVALAAAKFALVAMFYMHLKQDHRLFSGVFVFPLIIAGVVIMALATLMAYHMAFAKSGG